MDHDHHSYLLHEGGGATMAELDLTLAISVGLLLCVLARQWWLRRRARCQE